MPSKPSHVEINSVGSQSDKRFLATFRDQHKSARFPNGRPWWGYLELPSDPAHAPGPCGAIWPGDHELAAQRDWSGQWDAPWLPQLKYLELNLRKYTLYINYPQMISDFKTAMEKHYFRASEVAYEKNWPEPQWLGPIDHNIASVIGKIPLSHKIPEAAMAGDPWLLGMQEEPNEKLKRLLSQSREQGVWERPEAPELPVNIDELVAQKVAEALANTGKAKTKAPAAAVAGG